MTTTINGRLEIDHSRGVIYFHSTLGITILRICSLPVPIPEGRTLDITHLHGQDWLGQASGVNRYYPHKPGEIMAKKEKKKKFKMPERLYGIIPDPEAATKRDITQISTYVSPELFLHGEPAEDTKKGIRAAVYDLVGYVTIRQDTQTSELEDIGG